MGGGGIAIVVLHLAGRCIDAYVTVVGGAVVERPSVGTGCQITESSCRCAPFNHIVCTRSCQCIVGRTVNSIGCIGERAYGSEGRLAARNGYGCRPRGCLGTGNSIDNLVLAICRT